MRSFSDDPTLKDELLAALDERIASASMELLEVRGQRFAPYDFTEPDTFDIAAEMLRVPEDLLQLGSYLYADFPDDKRAIVDHLRSARGWLASIPVGADLSSVTREFALWRITDEHDGIIRFVRRADVRAALDGVALTLLYDETDRTQAGEAVEALRKSLQEERAAAGRLSPIQQRAARRRFRKQLRQPAAAHENAGTRADDELGLDLRALETAQFASYIGRWSGSAAAVAERSRIAGEWREQQAVDDAMKHWLVSRLGR